MKKRRVNQTVIEKDWGREIIVVNNEEANYCGKVLEIDPGKNFSMHMHDVKEETFLCQSGCGRLMWVDTATGEVDDTIIGGGDVVDVPRLTPHQIQNHGTEKLVIVEFSTFHRDSDSYRMWRELR